MAKMKIKEEEMLDHVPIIDGYQQIKLGDMENTETKLKLLKYTTEVQSRIRKDISSDFVLAKLGKQDREGIIEMTSNAYFYKRLMEMVKNARKWEWNEEQQMWKRVDLSEAEKARIQESTNQTFDTFLNRIYMTVILSRNVEKNHLLKMLSKYDDADEESIEEITDKENILDKAKRKILGIKKEKKEDKD